MKIVIATCGTRGDIQPLIALARASIRRGHQTLIAAPPEHGLWVENCRCAFQALGSDFTEMLRRYPQVHTLRPMMSFLGILRREIRKQLSRLPGIIEGANLVLGASLCCGLGPKPIRRSRLTAGRLAAAINECVCGPGYYDRASAIAGEIEKQDSLRLAADYLEKTYFSA